MKTVIFGSNGMLGNYVKNYLLDNDINTLPLTRNEFDLTNTNVDNLDKFIKTLNLNPNDVIINCSGIIPQSSAYRNVNNREYYKINSIFPVILSSLCEKYKLKMIHITTDCVFSGKDGNYNENSIHDETNDYGVSKSLGELCKATIIRTSIIGEEKYNKRSLLEWVKSNKNKIINGYSNHYWNGVTCLELSKIILKIINENLYWIGVRHFYSPNKLSKYQLINIINDEYDLNITINESKTEIIDKSLCSIYNLDEYKIPDLKIQINELNKYKIRNFHP